MAPELIKNSLTQQLPTTYFEQFLRRDSNLTLDRVDLLVLCGDERNILKTAINGDSTLVLRYKKKEGSLLSLDTETENLGIIQFQGARGEAGYRLNNEMRLPNFFADQIKTLTEGGLCRFKRIWMPQFEMIEGLIEANSQIAFERYKLLATILGLKYSAKEGFLVRDVVSK